METQQGGIKWTPIIWAAVLMFIIPLVISILIPTLYGTYVGFSTRGDMTQVNTAIQGLGSSMVYQVFMYVVSAAVALWRSSVLVKKVTVQQLLHVGIAVVITAVLVLAYYIIVSQGALGAIRDALITVVMIIGGAYLGTLLKPSKTAEA